MHTRSFSRNSEVSFVLYVLHATALRKSEFLRRFLLLSWPKYFFRWVCICPRQSMAKGNYRPFRGLSSLVLEKKKHVPVALRSAAVNFGVCVKSMIAVARA